MDAEGDGMIRLAAMVLVVLGTVGTTGCGAGKDCQGVHCEPCPAPITIEVVDPATGDPVPGVTIIAIDGDVPGDCVESDDATLCYIFGEPGDEYRVSLRAGDCSGTIHVRVLPSSGERCCDCGYEPVHDTFSLNCPAPPP